MTELWSRYTGQLAELWFDGGDDFLGVNETATKYEPQAVYLGGSIPFDNLRWIGTERGLPSYTVWKHREYGASGASVLLGQPCGRCRCFA